MRKLQIFLKLKYQETIGACLNWKKVLIPLLQFILLMIIAVAAVVGCGSIVWGLGSMLIWIFGGTYDSEIAVSLGGVTILGSIIVLAIVLVLSNWIKDNWKKTEEIYKEELIRKEKYKEELLAAKKFESSMKNE